MANTLYVDEQLLEQAEQVLEKLGLDAGTVTRMALKRVVNDGGISFLVADLPKIEVGAAPAAPVPEAGSAGQDRMIKSTAVNLFKSKGFTPSHNCTFASKNKSGNYYWANPVFDVLQQDWYLILNDWAKRELHLFKVPGRKLKEADLKGRPDRPDMIDLQIAYGDVTFTDSRSKISFEKFLVKTISY